MGFSLGFLVLTTWGTLFLSKTSLVGLDFDLEIVTWKVLLFYYSCSETVKLLDLWICTFFLTKTVIHNLWPFLHGTEGQCSLELHIYYLPHFPALLPEFVFPVTHVLCKQKQACHLRVGECILPQIQCVFLLSLFGVIMESSQWPVAFEFLGKHLDTLLYEVMQPFP